MSHRRLDPGLRLTTAVLIAVVGVTIAAPVGSQEDSAPVLAAEALPFGGTVVLRFTAESAGQTILEMEFRCSRPTFMVAVSGEGPSGEQRTWYLEGQVGVIPGKPVQIEVSLWQASLRRRARLPSLELSVQVGAVLASGEEKVLFQAEDVTLRVKAVFEPAQ
jgi:hypothetical protein